MTCTAATIAFFLGWMPPKGTVISVPRSQIAQLSITQQWKAKACAARYGIRWRIDETK